MNPFQTLERRQLQLVHGLVVGTGDLDDLGDHRYIRILRFTRSTVWTVLHADVLRDFLEVRCLCNDLSTPPSDVLVRVPGFENCRLGESDPADVVHECRILELGDLVGMESDLTSNRHREVGSAGGVSSRSEVGYLGNLSERSDHLAIGDSCGVVANEGEVAEGVREDRHWQRPQAHFVPRHPEQRSTGEDRQRHGPVFEGEQPEVAGGKVLTFGPDPCRHERPDHEPHHGARGNGDQLLPCERHR